MRQQTSFSVGPCCYYLDANAPVRIKVWFDGIARAWHVSLRNETWDAALDFQFAKTRRGRWNLICVSDQVDKRGCPILFANVA